MKRTERTIVRRRRFRMERLEQRQLLAADGMSLAVDVFSADQSSDPILLDVLANDSFDDDYTGARKITAASTGSLGGRIEIIGDGSMVQYTPPADRVGVEEFRYTVDDRESAEVSVDIVSPLSPFQTTIDFFADEYEFNLLRNASFLEDYAGERRITLVSETALGAMVQISDDGQSVSYRTDTNVSGKDHFTFIVDDKYVSNATINLLNPLARDRYEVVENSGATRLDVLRNDFAASHSSDEGVVSESVWQSTKQNAKITHVFVDSEGANVSIIEDGRAIEITPNEDYYGYQSIRYVVDGRFEQVASVTVQRAVKDDYVGADVNGGVHSLDVLENDYYRSILSNVDVRIVNQISSVGEGDQGGVIGISADGKQILYTPAADFAGTETFEYVADNKYRATVRVQVDPPVRDDSVTAYGGWIQPIDVLANDFLDSSGESATITEVSESALGATIVIRSDNFIEYHVPDFDLDDAIGRQDTFTYTVNEATTATVHVSLRVPTQPDYDSIDGPFAQTLYVLGNDHFDQHYQGSALITSVSQPDDGGLVTIRDDGKSLSYQPGSASETFTYTVDDRYTETVSFYPIGRLVPDHGVADQNGPAIEIDVLANDFPSYLHRNHGVYQGDRVVTSVTPSQEGGIVSVDDNGIVSYQPPIDFVGLDTFEYEVDGFLRQAIQVNVVRRAADDTWRVDPDSENNELKVLANDILGADYTQAGLISDVDTSSTLGEVTISEDRRTLVYTPPSGFQGSDTFVYSVDGQSKANVTVIVGDQRQTLDKFESAEQFRDFLLDLATERHQGLFEQPYYSWRSEEYISAATDSITHSETNVQVAGVDEDDIVETDGHFIYTLRGSELTIVRSLPADQLEVVSRTEIEGTPEGMYLSGDRITVISRKFEPITPVDSFNSFVADASNFAPFPLRSTTIVTVLDVENRGAPSIVQRTEFDASFSDSRRIGDQVFLVLESSGLVPEPETICDDDTNTNCVYESQQQFIDRVTANFSQLIEDLLPGYESYDSDGNLVRGGPLLLPEDIFRSSDLASNMTIVTSLDMTADQPGLSAVAGVMSDSNSKIFASASSLYVFDDYREQLENETWTKVLKFDWDGETGAIQYAASGDVPGFLLNQFSASESDGLLRITTEISNQGTGNFSGQNETGVFVLSDNDGVLEYVGGLQNLALGQNIKSVRYFGDRVFVTTFQNVDPLYAIDLSDSESPRALGHVPIPGFSSYMQFISPDRLLTIGTNTATGFGGRAMVSLFDVADLTSPRLIDQYNLPQYSTSQANNDHHAFGWFANHELLSVPISRYFRERFDADDDGYKEATRTVREDALSILHIDANGTGDGAIQLRGEVDHDAEVQRSVSINDAVYSVGLDGVRAVNVADPKTIVDEVVFDWDLIVDEDPWRPLDRIPLAEKARQMVAQSEGVLTGDVMLVTQERNGNSVDVVLRSGSDYFRYRGTDESDLALADSEFSFQQGEQNLENPLDANDDGGVTVRDALLVINEIAAREDGDGSAERVLRQVNVDATFVDTNGDGRVTASDALGIINAIARAEEGSGSNEAIAPNQVAQVSQTSLRTSVVDQFHRDDETHRLF